VVVLVGILVSVLVGLLGGLLEGVLEGVLRAGLFLAVGLSIVSVGSGKIGAGSKLLVRCRYSEVLRGTMGEVVVFLWRLIPGLVVGFLLNRKGGSSSSVSSSTKGSVSRTGSSPTYKPTESLTDPD